jgi:hypothetical protein
MIELETEKRRTLADLRGMTIVAATELASEWLERLPGARDYLKSGCPMLYRPPGLADGCPGHKRTRSSPRRHLPAGVGTRREGNLAITRFVSAAPHL